MRGEPRRAVFGSGGRADFTFTVTFGEYRPSKNFVVGESIARPRPFACKETYPEMRCCIDFGDQWSPLANNAIGQECNFDGPSFTSVTASRWVVPLHKRPCP